jgi:site-specific DNA recombinase
MTEQRRAIGIIRVSRVKGRKGADFQSPDEQRERIESECQRNGLPLLRTTDEMDVSGATPLKRRTGLREAVEAVEAGEAEVIVAGYFDRFFRDLQVQREVVQRVRQAGGYVLAVGFGEVKEDTASEWLSSTMHGMMSEYLRRQAKERIAEAQRRAVARGVLPYPNTTPGYLTVRDDRGKNPVLKPHPVQAPIVAEAFRMRDTGSTIKQVRAYLRGHGIERTYHGVQSLLRSRVVLGEIHFGELVNLHAHPPIVDVETWQRVQRRLVTRGRKAKSDHLLARVRVLRCGTCGGLLNVANSSSRYPVYRCSPLSDCENRAAISTHIADRVITEAVRARLADVTGRASAASNAQDAELRLEQSQEAFDAAIRAFDGFDEPSARDRLLQLREVRDEAQARVDKLGGAPVTITVNAATDWDLLTLDERRGLIRATVERATVARGGRGADRITLKLLGEQTASSAV